MRKKYTYKLILFLLSLIFLPSFTLAAQSRTTFWEFQSIDTVKYSRDLAREKLNDLSFDEVIEKHVSGVASLGATHIAIATPYDSEFLPYLKRWVVLARKYNLNIWYRGNWSGWEKWFGYPAITRVEHISKTKAFISSNPDLFQNGDIFTACPECENGGPGDPRQNKDLVGHRNFLIEEHKMMKDAFRKINKNILFNFNSMNGDVARLVMDRATTAALGGIVTIDHYVKTPDKLISDIKEIQSKSGGRVVLGEIGVPIPDIHGRLNDSEQAKWLEDALVKLVTIPGVVGINYWLSYGGSTSLWRDSGALKPIAETLKPFFKPKVLTGYVMDSLDKPISAANIKSEYVTAISKTNGYFEIPYMHSESTINLTIISDGFNYKNITVDKLSEVLEVKLEKIENGFWFRVVGVIKSFFSFVL